MGSVWDWIKSHRIREGRSQAEYAEMLGMSQPAYSRRESAGATPDRVKERVYLERLGKALELPDVPAFVEGAMRDVYGVAEGFRTPGAQKSWHEHLGRKLAVMPGPDGIELLEVGDWLEIAEMARALIVVRVDRRRWENERGA